jgi:hypothetical protein
LLDPRTLAGLRYVLARESPADNIGDALSRSISANVVVDWNGRPVLAENFLAEKIALYKLHGLESAD